MAFSVCARIGSPIEACSSTTTRLHRTRPPLTQLWDEGCLRSPELLEFLGGPRKDSEH